MIVSNPKGRTILVGDVHGCYNEVVALLKKCDHQHNDNVIMLGDLIDRGPENAKCVDLARHYEQLQGSPACVMGNHESRHIEYSSIAKENGSLDNIPQNHIDTRKQLTEDHYDYFRSLPLFIRLPDYNSICVHAGVFPGRKIEEQSPRHLMSIQMINPEISEQSQWPSRCDGKPGWKFWSHFWDGPEHIIFGHSVFNQPLLTSKVSGIDGGAVFGLSLHALILPERKIVSIHSQENYKKRKHSFFIDENVYAFS